MFEDVTYKSDITTSWILSNVGDSIIKRRIDYYRSVVYEERTTMTDLFINRSGKLSRNQLFNTFESELDSEVNSIHNNILKGDATVRARSTSKHGSYINHKFSPDQILGITSTEYQVEHIADMEYGDKVELTICVNLELSEDAAIRIAYKDLKEEYREKFESFKIKKSRERKERETLARLKAKYSDDEE